MNHNQNDGLLKMIRRTDPMISFYLDFATKQEGLRRFIDSEGLLSPE